jgi:hypothetical protein
MPAPTPLTTEAPAHTTLNDVVNLVATSVGHPKAADVVSTTDEAILRLSYYANAACINLMTMHNWQQFSKTCIIPVVGSSADSVEESFALPADFKVMTDDTHWNRSTQLPAIGPVNPQDWQWLVVRNTKITTRFMWRIRDGLLWVKSPPYPNPQNFSFEYLSKNWAVDGDTGFGKDYMNKNTDYHLFPWELVVFYTRVLWMQNEGYDATAAMASFKNALAYETGTDKGATALSLVPGMGYPYIDAIRNIPDTGYGGAP